MIVSTDMLTVKQQIAQLLQQSLSGVDVTEGFSPQQYFLSLSRPMLCVTIQKILSHKEYMENFIGVHAGDASSADLYGYFCDIGFGIFIYLPKGYKEKDGNDLFLSVCSQLLFQQDYEFTEISCGEMVFDEKLQAFMIQVTAKTSLILTRQEEFSALSSIQIKKKEETV